MTLPSDSNPWIPLSTLLLWARYEVAEIADQIELGGLYVRDQFGRWRVSSLDDDEEKPISATTAMRLLADYYADHSAPYPDADAVAEVNWLEGPDSPFYDYGWPFDELPAKLAVAWVNGVWKKTPADQRILEPLSKPPLNGVPKRKVVEAFQFWSKQRWNDLLAKPPQWLEVARVGATRPKHTSYWNPAIVALAVAEYRQRNRISNNPAWRALATKVPSHASLTRLLEDHFPEYLKDWLQAQEYSPQASELR